MTKSLKVILKKYRLWCESIIVGDTLEIRTDRLLDTKQILSEIEDIIAEEKAQSFRNGYEYCKKQNEVI